MQARKGNSVGSYCAETRFSHLEKNSWKPPNATIDKRQADIEQDAAYAQTAGRQVPQWVGSGRLAPAPPASAYGQGDKVGFCREVIQLAARLSIPNHCRRYNPSGMEQSRLKADR